MAYFTSNQSISSNFFIQNDLIDHAPEEIFINIFSYLPPKDLLSVSLVCKRWNVLSEDASLWKKFFAGELYSSYFTINAFIKKWFSIFTFKVIDPFSHFPNFSLETPLSKDPSYVRLFLDQDKNLRILAPYHTVDGSVERFALLNTQDNTVHELKFPFGAKKIELNENKILMASERNQNQREYELTKKKEWNFLEVDKDSCIHSLMIENSIFDVSFNMFKKQYKIEWWDKIRAALKCDIKISEDSRFEKIISIGAYCSVFFKKSAYFFHFNKNGETQVETIRKISFVGDFLSATKSPNSIFFSTTGGGLTRYIPKTSHFQVYALKEGDQCICHVATSKMLVIEIIRPSQEEKLTKHFSVHAVKNMASFCSLKASTAPNDSILSINMIERVVVATFLHAGVHFWMIPEKPSKQNVSSQLIYCPSTPCQVDNALLHESHSWGFSDGKWLLVSPREGNSNKRSIETTKSSEDAKRKRLS